MSILETLGLKKEDQVAEPARLSDATIREALKRLAQKIVELERQNTSRRGPEGAPGPQGPAGRNGVDGRPGRDGIDGVSNLPGPSGKDGKDGRSIVGPAGKDGKNGIDGQNGRDGINGRNGVDGVDGKNGLDGKNGVDARIAIGTVVVGPEASASIRVVDGVHILDLVLPRAEKGDKGDTGAQGLAGKDSEKVGPQGKPGSIDQAVHNARLAISEELQVLVARVQKLEEKVS
jgi:collagen triple helix repeat protein